MMGRTSRRRIRIVTTAFPRMTSFSSQSRTRPPKCFGGRVRDWDENDVILGKAVVTILIRRRDVRPIIFQGNQRIDRGQQHAVIELVTDLFHDALDGYKVQD